MSAGLRAVIASSRAGTSRLRPRPVSRFDAGPTALPDLATDIGEEVDAPARAQSKTPRVAINPVVDPAPHRTPKAPTVDRGDEPARATPTAVPAAPAIARVTPDPPHAPAAAPPGFRPAPPAETPPAPAGAALLPAAPVPQRINHVGLLNHSEPVIGPAHPDPVSNPEPGPPPRTGALVPHPIPAVLPAALPGQPPRRRADHHAAVAAAPPEVHVSIGRIEVRAVTATDPARATDRTPTRSAVVGLDEYLAQRGSR